MIELFPHHTQCLELNKNKARAAYFLDMGLGKTFIASEKARKLGNPVLVICQKSKIADWQAHFKEHYELPVTVINYDSVWRRSEFLNWQGYTLILDESSLIKNEAAKRTKFVLALQPSSVILLSGTPTGGKYEELWTQCRLLEWNISKKLFYDHFIVTETIDVGGMPVVKVVGYKNVERLKQKLHQYGAVFMKSEEVINLSEQVDIVTTVAPTKAYRQFKRDKLIRIEQKDLIGDTPLKQLLYERQLCGQYSQYKVEALKDLLQSTQSRIVIFYNFTAEYELIRSLTDRPISYINGQGADLENYRSYPDSITLIQYQAGAMGHNLELANIAVYFTLPLSAELFEQSRKRIHRIGQTKPCFYYYLITQNSVEEKILTVLKERRDYTEALFRKEEH